MSGLEHSRALKLFDFGSVLVASKDRWLLKPRASLLSHHLLEDSFWGHPTDKQVETDSLSFVNPDVQKLLPERVVELKVWKDKEKKRGRRIL